MEGEKYREMNITERAREMKSVNVQRHLLLSGAFHLVGVLAKLCSLIDGKSDLSFAFV